MNLEVRRKSVFILLTANLVLLTAAWVMCLYVYPRLPGEIPLWLNFYGQPVMKTEKSPLFFLYPSAQTLFFIAFRLLAGLRLSGVYPSSEKDRHSTGKKNLFRELEKEFVYLVLIFFNLVFIHIQRSIILLAHDIEKGVDRFYFYSLFGIILLMIPFFRLKAKLMAKGDRQVFS